jgi:hypothetical protein
MNAVFADSSAYFVGCLILANRGGKSRPKNGQNIKRGRGIRNYNTKIIRKPYWRILNYWDTNNTSTNEKEIWFKNAFPTAQFIHRRIRDEVY